MARLTPPKSPMVCEKHQKGCMWRLYDLFDFRQGHSSKKLISDKRHSNRFDRKISKMKLELLTNLDEKSQSMDDKMMNKASPNSQSLPLKDLKGEAKNGKPSCLISLEKYSDKLNSETLAEEAHGKKRSNYEITTPQAHNKSAEAIVNQKFIDEMYIRANDVNYQSRQLSDALEILNSNKELFLKLLQDPNSLLAKHMEDIRKSQAVKHWMKSPSDGDFSAPRQCDVHADTRKLKSSDTIVVLKPGPTSMRNAQGNTSYILKSNREDEMHRNFSFSRIKKKLRYAIGVSRKEKYSKSEDTTLHRSPYEDVKEGCKRKGVKFVRRNSPGGGMTISPLEIKKRDNIIWGREFGSDIQCETASTSGSGFENLNISDVSESSLEPMLLELLNNGNKDRRHEMQDQKILDSVISFHEYDFLPTRSPVGLSSYSNFQLLYENKWRLQKEQISCLSPTENRHIMHQGVTDSLEESIHRNGTTKTNEMVNSGEINASEDLRTSDRIEKTSTVDTDPAVKLSKLNCQDKANIYEEDGYFKTSFQDQLSTSSSDIFQSPPRVERLEGSASIEDKGEHPSPVSVLEPFFVDAISEHCEEHHSAHLTSTSSLNEHEIIEYIQEVLQAASLDWDEISMMRDASDQLLDPFLFDTVKLHRNQLHDDFILLFHCIDEVLVDVSRSDLRHSPWLSFIKPTVRQLSFEEIVIEKVMKYVEWHNAVDPTPRTMQQIVEKDIAQSVTWLDIRKDAEDVVFQIVEDVLEELIIETIVQLQLLHIFMAKFTCCDDDTKIQCRLCNYTLESFRS